MIFDGILKILKQGLGALQMQIHSLFSLFPGLGTRSDNLRNQRKQRKQQIRQIDAEKSQPSPRWADSMTIPEK